MSVRVHTCFWPQPGTRPIRSSAFRCNAFRKFRTKEKSGGTPEKLAVLQSQGDCVFQPRVARNELPWVPGGMDFNPNGVESRFRRRAATPFGLFAFGHVSQGSSFLATLGFEPESLWDSSLEFPKCVTFKRQGIKTSAPYHLKAELQTRIPLGLGTGVRLSAVVSKSLLLLFLLVLAASGCTTKSKAKAQARTAFLLGQQQAIAQQQQGTVVTVVGQVRNRTIQWTEELTLTKALVAAEYQGFSDPRVIIIIRNGQQFQVNVKQMLKGREDPPLDAGDTIQIQQ